MTAKALKTWLQTIPDDAIIEIEALDEQGYWDFRPLGSAGLQVRAVMEGPQKLTVQAVEVREVEPR